MAWVSLSSETLVSCFCVTDIISPAITTYVARLLPLFIPIVATNLTPDYLTHASVGQGMFGGTVLRHGSHLHGFHKEEQRRPCSREFAIHFPLPVQLHRGLRGLFQRHLWRQRRTLFVVNHHYESGLNRFVPNPINV